jgi:hypothetical protein
MGLVETAEEPPEERWEDWRWRRFRRVAQMLWHYSPLPRELVTKILCNIIVAYFHRTIYVMSDNTLDFTSSWRGYPSWRGYLVDGLVELVVAVQCTVNPKKVYGLKHYFVLREPFARHKLRHRSDFTRFLECTRPDSRLVVTYYDKPVSGRTHPHDVMAWS